MNPESVPDALLANIDLIVIRLDGTRVYNCTHTRITYTMIYHVIRCAPRYSVKVFELCSGDDGVAAFNPPPRLATSAKLDSCDLATVGFRLVLFCFLFFHLFLYSCCCPAENRTLVSRKSNGRHARRDGDTSESAVAVYSSSIGHRHQRPSEVDIFRILRQIRIRVRMAVTRRVDEIDVVEG